jgi:ParB-like nuclease domain
MGKTVAAILALALMAAPALAQQPEHEQHHPGPPPAAAAPNSGMPGGAMAGAGGMPMMGMMRMMMGPGFEAPTLPLRQRARDDGGGNQRPWPADKVERWGIERLIPYAKNARTHTDAQVAAIAASIKEWGWTTPALVGEDGGLIAGHARILAARQLGIANIPVMVAAGWSEAQKRERAAPT